MKQFDLFFAILFAILSLATLIASIATSRWEYGILCVILFGLTITLWTEYQILKEKDDE